MKRRVVIGFVAALALVPSAALAQGMAERIADELRRQGFTEIRGGTTLLGRGRVVGVGPEGRREIIFNPRTGEILRDYLRIEGSGGSGSGGGILGSGDRDDDDDDDDDDRSGSGGGGNDSDDDDDDGGGGSGSGSDDSDDDDD